MQIADVRKAFAMPLTDPSFPPGPYCFYNREFMVITYRTDVEALRAVVPEPLEMTGDTVAYEFIRMPDSTGFGDYTETGQVIPVHFTTPDGTVQEGSYVHAMCLDDNSPIAGGREIRGFPKKLGTPRICELVRYYTEEVTLKGARSGPAVLQFFKHAMCNVARLPVREELGAKHFLTDLTLGLDEVVHDYLAEA